MAGAIGLKKCLPPRGICEDLEVVEFVVRPGIELLKPEMECGVLGIRTQFSALSFQYIFVTSCSI